MSLLKSVGIVFKRGVNKVKHNLCTDDKNNKINNGPYAVKQPIRRDGGTLGKIQF
jgi:hypothetical protein